MAWFCSASNSSRRTWTPVRGVAEGGCSWTERREADRDMPDPTDLRVDFGVRRMDSGRTSMSADSAGLEYVTRGLWMGAGSSLILGDHSLVIWGSPERIGSCPAWKEMAGRLIPP